MSNLNSNSLDLVERNLALSAITASGARRFVRGDLLRVFKRAGILCRL